MQTRVTGETKSVTFQAIETIFVLTEGTGTFEFEYVVTYKYVEPEPDNAIYPRAITMGAGFSMLLIAFCIFEGPILTRRMIKWQKGKQVE